MNYRMYIMLLLLAIGGCSGETAKRMGYETMENIRINRCNKDFSADCPGRESYDSYNRKRDDVIK